jgi:ERCC4-type nuclease
VKENIVYIGVDRRLRDYVVVELLAQDPTLGLVFLHLNGVHFLLSHQTAVVQWSHVDFIDRVRAETLFPWADDLSNRYAEPLLLIQGKDPFEEDAVCEEELEEAIFYLMAVRRIPVLYSETRERSAAIVRDLARQVHAESRARIDLRRKVRDDERRIEQERVVAGLPGVGPKLARSLLETFKSPRNVFSSSINDLLKIKGLGNTRASQIEDLLTSDYR